MITTLAKIKQLYFTLEASAAAIAKQGWYSEDTHRLGIMEADGTTKRFFWDSTRLADQTASYGTSLIGTPGIAGVTPAGGTVGAAATLQAMLTGIKNYSAAIVPGTVGVIQKVASAGTLGDSLLVEVGNAVILSAGNNGPTIFSTQNTTSGTASTASFSLASNGSLAGGLLLASSAYTAEAALASRLSLYSAAAGTGINLISRNTTDTIKSYFGSVASSTTLFHTLSNKGIKLENIVLSTDADGAIGGLDGSLSITKNDANTRQFYGQKIVATLNTGGSNAATTVDLFSVDTVNTAITGLSVNLLTLKYGGTERARVDSFGRMGQRIGAGNAIKGIHHIVDSAHTDTSWTPLANADCLVLENNDDTGLTILVPTSKKAWLNFAKNGVSSQGAIYYDMATDLLSFQIAGAAAASISATAFSLGGQVLTTPRSGWTGWTGTPTRSGFATSTATLANVAQTLKALIDDLLTHGLIAA